MVLLVATLKLINKELEGQSLISNNRDYDIFIQKFILLCLDMYSYAIQNNIRKIIIPGASFDKFKFIITEILDDDMMEIINIPFSSGFNFIDTLDKFYKSNYKTIISDNKKLVRKHNDSIRMINDGNKLDANKLRLEILTEANTNNKYELGKILDIVLNYNYLDDSIKYLFEHTLKNNLEPIIQCVELNCQFGIIDFVLSGKGMYSFYILCLLYIKYAYTNDKTRMINFIKNTHLIYYKSERQEFDPYDEEFNFEIQKENEAIENGFPNAINKLVGERIKIKTKVFHYDIEYKGLGIDNYTSFDYQRCVPSYKYNDWYQIPNLEESTNCIIEKIIFLDNMKKLSDSDYKMVQTKKPSSRYRDKFYLKYLKYKLKYINLKNK